jgi:hypothetical protein
MICGRCDEPILPGEEVEPYDISSPSGAGTTVYLHKVLCTPVPTQTAPVSIRR